MARHNQLGAAGELLAAEWLAQKAFIILHTNWRFAHCEVDIIASHGKVLHFIEVKTRSGNSFGQPEESVDRNKLLQLLKAGEAFQEQYPQWKQVQYDVLSISLAPEGDPKFFFIEDVYL